MSRIFLSHSSADEFESVALKEWLTANGWDDVFLDIDPRCGLTGGERWQEALRRAADRCEAVVFAVTPAWAQSKWCQTEFLLAKSLGKRIFGVIVKPVEIAALPIELTAEWQLCQLTGDGPKSALDFTHGGQNHHIEFLTDGLTRLRTGLENAGLDARHFPWPPAGEPKRPPYRGLAALEEQDAAIYFGRDAQIVRGLDALRGMRADGIETLFVILGPSATGKSSFLRAGLLPRLKRDDRHFLPLPVIRPERHPITGEYGLAVSIHQANLALGVGGQTLGAIKAALEKDTGQMTSMLAAIQRAAHDRLVAGKPGVQPPTLLLCVDQAEELFNPDATAEARRFLALIGEILRETGPQRLPLIVAFTIRSDRYEPLQTAPELAGLKSRVFDDLKPIALLQFKEVIVGPAQRATQAGNRLEIQPQLVERLAADCAHGADTLPLLSLTLARLYRDYGSDGDLRLDEYEDLGGMSSVVNQEAESVFTRDLDERQKQLEHLRAAFIPWLATINPQNDEPMRRVARFSDLPAESRSLINALVEKRLLLADQRAGEKVVEVAHEAILRQWDVLADWLRAERDDLKAADALLHAAQEWAKNGRKAPWLMAGERLTLAEELAAKPGFRKRLDACREFLLASRRREDSMRKEEEGRRQAELEAAQKLAAEQTARADAEEKAKAEAQESAARLLALLKEATALRLVYEAQDMLAHTRSGGDERALLQLVAAARLAPVAEVEGGLLAGLVRLHYVNKLFNSGAQVIISVAAGQDGNRIASAGEDGTVRQWDAATGQPIGASLKGHKRKVISVAYSLDGSRIVSGGDDGSVRQWDAHTGQPIGAPLKGHEKGAYSVAYSPDGSRIVSGGHDGAVRLWDANTGQLIGAPFTGHKGWVSSVVYSPDGSRIVSGGADGTVRQWDVRTGQPVGALLTVRGGVNSVAYSPDGSRVISGIEDGTVRQWDANTGQPICAALKVHEGYVNSVAYSPDGSRIVTGGEDGAVCQWDANTGRPIGEPLTVHEGYVSSVAYGPDGSYIVTGGGDGAVCQLDANIGRPIGELFTVHEGYVSSVAYGPDGSYIVIGDRDGVVCQLDANTGQPIGAPLMRQGSVVRIVAYSPDGSHIVFGSWDGAVCQWDARAGQSIGAPLVGHDGWVSCVAYSPDGSHIVTGGDDGTVRQWDANTGQPIGAPLTGQGGAVRIVAYSPDGRRIVSGSYDGSVRQWDANTGQLIGAPLTGHEGEVSCVAYSLDGSHIVSGGADGTVRLWDANTGHPISAPLRGHESFVWSVAFSPDDSRIVSGGVDGTVRLWDANTGHPIGAPLTRQEGAVSSVSFSPDGSRIVAGREDGTVRLWPAPKAWPGELCNKLTRNMSRKEWREWVSPEIPYTCQCPGLPISPDDPNSTAKPETCS